MWKLNTEHWTLCLHDRGFSDSFTVFGNDLSNKLFLSFIICENVIVILNVFDTSFCNVVHNSCLLKSTFVTRIILPCCRIEEIGADRKSLEESFCFRSHIRRKLDVCKRRKIILVHLIFFSFLFFTFVCFQHNLIHICLSFCWNIVINMDKAILSEAKYQRWLDFFFAAALLNSGLISW